MDAFFAIWTDGETEAPHQHSVTSALDSAVTKTVDRLLASPHYGERWGRHWLDVARYADTQGLRLPARSGAIPFAYTYRDYVIRAFNDDLPYDQFILEQLAADRLVAEDRRRAARWRRWASSRSAGASSTTCTTSSTTASTW